LEGQITIVIEATSHENNRRGRRPLHVGGMSRGTFSADRSRRRPAEPHRAQKPPRKRPSRA